MNITDTPLVNREVSKRAHGESKLKKNQQSQMGQHLIENPSHAFHQSVVASGVSFIASALMKLREEEKK
jgi:hypothetical protein